MADKTTLTNNVIKNALSQGTGAVVSKAFGVLMTALGHPEVAAMTPLVRGAAMGVVNKYYDDFTHRMLSALESEKLDLFSKTAVQTYFEFADKDGVFAMQQQIADEYIQYAYEAAEGAILTAIRQSQRTKIEILGRYFGSQLYKGPSDWQDMHQILSMSDTLTLRQMVMIRLIADDFKGLDTKLFISNPSACVEVNRLLDFGIWQTQGASFGTNTSWKIQLESIIPTIYSEQVSKALMLERLSNDDVQKAINSLALTPEGTAEAILTEEDYRKHTEWQMFDKDGNVKVMSFEEDDDPMHLLDVARGK